MERKLLLLGILRQQEMHGYQLFDFIEQGLSTCTNLTKPTAYYLLKQMAEEGWIVVEHSQEG
jgi:DNA-binding PadR family transcriptional regulator